MKAYRLRRYGSPDELEPVEIPTPDPGDGEVLVRVRATSVNPYDWHLMRGQPYLARLMPGVGLRGPTIRVLGCDMAGEVAAVGNGVTGYQPGDKVFALLTGGGFGEYVSVPANLLAAQPANISHEQAAAVPMAAVTALLALRDSGGLRPGQSVLVTGASGGVGTFAVQLARALGAKVTGVCRTANLELVRSIGADEVVDYTVEDPTRGERRHDLIVDIAGRYPVSACRRLLTPKGTFVVVGGPAGRWVRPIDRVLGAALQGRFVAQRMVTADSVGHADKKRELDALAELIQAGTVTPVIDRTYRFDELPDAVRYQEAGHAAGKVVVTL